MATFKTRARALDMLGRQQIAGIPTAIAELFKNAHDAYADRVEVDYFRWNKLFLLRDDGVGMTQQEFETRWLTLGTESKSGSASNLPPLPKSHKDSPRPVLGEKGIGRLAIAVVGPQVLILTKAAHGNGELVAAFIHWGVFEAPGVNLDQIEVPVRTFPAGTLPTQADILEMVERVKRNVSHLSNSMDMEWTELLQAELSTFDVNPQIFDGYLKGPSLRNAGHGTHFYIQPASELLEADIRGDEGDITEPPLSKLLLGFTNTMTPDHDPPVLDAKFRDHRNIETYDNLIAPGKFFTPEEFKQADHHIEGQFDKYGQFSGTVTVYGEQAFEHEEPWRAARGRETDCGPFRIELAYVQGEQRSSKLSPEDYQRLIRKLNRIGGLYLYRDGIRILPYGDTDYDWLDIEKNRTKKASYYYFSYRRLFGVVELTREDNTTLSEKAGREGFRENKAYRQFRDILKNFFLQIAATYFRQGGEESDYFTQRRAELDRLERARREREKQAADDRRKFSRRLKNVFSEIDANKPQKRVNQVLGSATRATKKLLETDDRGRTSYELIEVELNARRELDSVRSSFKIERPRGLGLTSELDRDWRAYLREWERLDKEIFQPAFGELEGIIGEEARKARLEVDSRRRLEQMLNSATEDAREKLEAESNETKQMVSEATTKITKTVQESEARLSQEAKNALETLAASDRPGTAIASIERDLERRIGELVEQERRRLTDIREELRDIGHNGGTDGHPFTTLDTVAALEDEVLALRESSEAELELIQLGQSLDLINHEFNQTIEAVRENLRRMKPWADVNPDLGRLYSDLRATFEHLDGYLTLFTPLNRRLYRRAVEIRGRDINEYLRKLFRERLQNSEVQLQATPAFLNTVTTGYPSTFYPVFVNLIDNAIFWVRELRSEKIITLDAHGDALLVSDNGPGVNRRDLDAIFELGFTRKPGGRGLGLHISQSILEREGYRLELAPDQAERGTTFRIEPMADQDRNGDDVAGD